MFVGVGVAFRNFSADGHEPFVLQPPDGAGRGLGQLEELFERHLAPLVDDMPNLLLSLGEFGQFTGGV